MQGMGFDLPDYLALRDLVREHMPVLQEIRTRQLRKAMDEGRL
jgi:hypothetical protein